MLTMGVMEFSMAVFASNFVSYAAHGARFASTRGNTYPAPGTDTIQTFLRSLAVGLTTGGVTTTTTWIPPGHKDPGAQVRVVVKYT
jgi:Flp pilus assembly protein TadG